MTKTKMEPRYDGLSGKYLKNFPEAGWKPPNVRKYTYDDVNNGPGEDDKGLSEIRLTLPYQDTMFNPSKSLVISGIAVPMIVMSSATRNTEHTNATTTGTRRFPVAYSSTGPSSGVASFTPTVLGS